MIGKRIVSGVSLLFVCLVLSIGIAAAGSLKDIQFIMVAVNDAKATIRNPDGSLQVIQPGDVIADTFTVKNIMPGRITLANSAADGPKAVIVRLEYGRQWLEFLGSSPQQPVAGGAL